MSTKMVEKYLLNIYKSTSSEDSLSLPPAFPYLRCQHHDKLCQSHPAKQTKIHEYFSLCFPHFFKNQIILLISAAIFFAISKLCAYAMPF